MKRLVVLIYGSNGGDGKFGKYFPDLIASDPLLSELYETLSVNCRIGFFRSLFSGKKFALESPLAGLRKILSRRGATYSKIAFVCHGMGGLVARNYIAEQVMSRQPLTVDRILLMAVPNTTTDLSRMNDSLSWKDVLEKAVCRHPEDLEKLNTEWKTNALEAKVAVKYILGEKDDRIDKSDALAHWGSGYFMEVSKKDHWGVFTPEDHDDPVFLITRRFLLAEEPAAKKYPDNLLAIADVLNWGLDASVLESAKKDMIALVDLLNQLPWRSRQVLCSLIQKADQIRYDEMSVALPEMSKTMNVTIHDLEAELSVLKTFELVHIIEDHESTKIHLRPLNENWLIWDQLKGYCQKTGIGLKRFIVDLQFDLLDLKKK